jgi:ribose transport system permease protein
VWGIPVLAFFALGIVLVVHIVVKATRLGRRFELVGENPRSAANIGISTRAYTVSAYWLATLLAAAAGVLLAGLLRSPTLTAGSDYLLPSIAAVVLGGTHVLGGKGSYLGTIAGVILITLLQSILSVMQIEEAGRQLIYGAVIVCMLLLYGRQKLA